MSTELVFLTGLALGIAIRDLPGITKDLGEMLAAIRNRQRPTRITISEEPAEATISIPESNAEPNLETWDSAINEIAEKNQDFFNPRQFGKPEDTYV